MNVTSNSALSSLGELFFSLFHFFQRPVVQSQVAAFAIAVIIAYYLRIFIWKKVGVRFKAWVERTEKGYFWQRIVRFVERMLFPLLGILALRVARQVFENFDSSSSLLDLCINYFWIFAAYRLLIALLYSFLNSDIVKQFHRPLIAPLFVVWLLMDFFGIVVNLDNIAQSQVINLFGHPLNLGTLFGTLWNIFLWIVITTALRESVLVFIRAYTRIDQGLAEAWLSILSYISYITASIVLLNRLGIDPNTIAFITGGLSVGIGFGLRAIIANFFSGIILLFERSIRPGDILKIDGKPVVVNQLQIRTTRVESYEGEEIIIPNETIFTSNLHTYTGSSNLVRCDIAVGIHYRHNPQEACDLILDIASRHIDVLAEPKPQCFVVEFADSSINLSLRVWLSNYVLTALVRSDLMKAIWHEFKAAGIEIPFPQQDIHIIEADKDLSPDADTEILQQNEKSIQSDEGLTDTTLPHQEPELEESPGLDLDEMIEQVSNKQAQTLKSVKPTST